jgi:hypothetical protein
MNKFTSTADRKINVEAPTQAIIELKSPRAKRERQRAEMFRKIYPAVRDQIVNGTSPSALVKLLAQHGVSIMQKKLMELIAEEAERRGEPMPKANAKTVSADDTEAA